MNPGNKRLWIVAILVVSVGAIRFMTQGDQPSTEPPASTASSRTDLPRLVDLGATQCKTCLKLAPILDALREEYAGRLDVVFINVWKDKESAKAYEFRVIPTQILYDAQGNEVWRHEGFISKEDLETVFAEKVHVTRSA